jgi:hypothetical protein
MCNLEVAFDGHESFEMDARIRYRPREEFYGHEEGRRDNAFLRSVKIPLPTFLGQHSKEWLYKVRHFFTSHNVKYEKMMCCALMGFEGEAL